MNTEKNIYKFVRVRRNIFKDEYGPYLYKKYYRWIFNSKLGKAIK